MRRTLIILGILLLVLLLVGACAPAPESPPTEPLPEGPPAEFEVSSLAVTPIVAEPGQAVTVKVEVENVGETGGTHTLTLNVNGVAEQTMDVTVSPFFFETAAFTLMKDATGIYDIEVSGLTETLRVKQAGAYPRLGNLYVGGLLSPESAQALAKWDLVVIEEVTRFWHPQYIKLIKELNPNVKILALVQVGCYCPIIRRLYSIDEDWFLHHPGTGLPEERRVVIFTYEETHPCPLWFGMNPASELSTWIPKYVHDEVMSTGLFDGVYYDCLYNDMWISNIDIDNDGIAESSAVVKREYRRGWAQLLKLTRELLGPEAIILGAPATQWSDDSPYWEHANGHSQECVLGTKTWSAHWPTVWDIYQRNMQKPSPLSRIHLIIVDARTNSLVNVDAPDLPPQALQRMRFGLAITLLEEGYFGFDLEESHYQLWWFPEYDANLGLAVGDAQERSDGSWMREFENGVVVANPTSQDSTIEFQAIHKDVTTGIEDTSFAVPSLDGRIFLKVD